MTRSIPFVALALCAATSLGAQQAPAIRQLGPVVATASEPFGAVVFVRHNKNGVLVNDVQNRRLLMFDSTLTTSIVVADTTPATANAYSGRVAGLIAYRGDSSLFIDAQSLSMLVIDPNGKVTRVMSVPRSQDAGMLGNAMMGTPGFDAGGRLVYRGMPRIQMRAGGAPGAPMAPPEMPDSAAVVRVDLATRAVDTAGFTKIPKVKMDMQRDEATGRFSFTVQMNPLPIVDEWAVLSDGSVAFVRGRDYHVDWVRPDGSRSSSPKIPFEWQRLTDEDKVAFIDSLKAARERILASAPAGPPSGNTVVGGGGPGGAPPGGGAGQRTEMIVMGGAPAGGAGGPPGANLGMNNRNVSFVPPNDLPDYKPPFFAGAARADADGNIWIYTIPTKAIAGGPVYDVINAQGELVDRVQVPKDRTIVGFGAGGVVYLAARDGNKTKLEKAVAK